MFDYFASHKFQSLPHKLIQPSRSALRSKLENIDELAHSITTKGLINPIVVRPIDRFYEVVCGNRRYAACRKLRWSMIPCQITDLSDKDAYEVALTENIQQNTLNAIEEAEAYWRYIEEYGGAELANLQTE